MKTQTHNKIEDLISGQQARIDSIIAILDAEICEKDDEIERLNHLLTLVEDEIGELKQQLRIYNNINKTT